MFQKQMFLLLALGFFILGCRSTPLPENPVPLQSITINFRNRDETIQIPIRNVAIAGTFNDWNTEKDFLADDDADGAWSITLQLKPGIYKYMLVINGFMWVSPPDAKEYVDDGFGNLNGILEVRIIRK